MEEGDQLDPGGSKAGGMSGCLDFIWDDFNLGHPLNGRSAVDATQEFRSGSASGCPRIARAVRRRGIEWVSWISSLAKADESASSSRENSPKV